MEAPAWEIQMTLFFREVTWLASLKELINVILKDEADLSFIYRTQTAPSQSVSGKAPYH